MTSASTVRRAIREMTEGRDVHIHWRDALRSGEIDGAETNARTVEETVGGPEWHDEWVRRYDRVLRILHALLEETP